MCYNLTWADKKMMDTFKNSNKHVCAYCGKKLSGNDKVTADHKHPVSRGGKTIASNLVISCECCNVEKSDMTYEEYMEYRQLKERLLSENPVYNQLNSLINTYENLINEFNNTVIRLQELNKDKESLEEIIRDEKFNAAEGYSLARDLKNILKDIQDKRNMQSYLHRSNEMARNNIKQVTQERDNLTRNIMNKIRSKYKIGQLAELNIEEVKFHE